MKRKAIDALIEWKTSENGKVILLTGAKGVGKTYLAYDFARAFFRHCIYINFERKVNTNYFENIETLKKIEAELINPTLGEGFPLLILDEINYSTNVEQIIDMVKCAEITPYIISITSLRLALGIKEQKDMFHLLPVNPMEFDEFLRATSQEWYIEAITHHYEANKVMPEIVHKELLVLHDIYLKIGGVPSVMNEYINFNATINVMEQQSLLLSSYRDYIVKTFQESDAYKMLQVYDIIPNQLIKDNRKFQYKLIRKGTTHGMYKDAIGKLNDLNYVIQTYKLGEGLVSNANQVYLEEYDRQKEQNTNFKLYFSDAGLLYNKMIVMEEQLSPIQIKQALLENYIAQSLYNKNYSIGFWESGSMAKVDFIAMKESEYILPIEIYSNDNTRSKSIHVLKQKCEFPYAIKVSTKNFEYANQIKYVPLYAVFCI